MQLTMMQDVIRTSNGLQHSKACMILSFLFAFCGFDAISIQKRLTFVKMSMTLMRKRCEIIKHTRCTFCIAKKWSLHHSVLLANPALERRAFRRRPLYVDVCRVYSLLPTVKLFWFLYKKHSVKLQYCWSYRS